MAGDSLGFMIKMVVGRDCYTESPRRGTPPREYE